MKLHHYLLLLTSFSVFNSCTTKEDKLKHLSQKWAFSDEDYKNRVNSIPLDVWNMSANITVELMKSYGKSVIELERSGKYTVSFPENTSSISASSLKTEGKWEVDEQFKTFRLIQKNGRVQTYIINELTRNSLKLSYFEDGKEFLEEYFPYTGKTAVQKESKQK